MIDGTCELDRPLAILLDGIERGDHLGGQLYVWQSGRVIADCAFGEARPGIAMQRDTLVNWLSTGKPLTAAAILLLVERGLIDLDEPVMRYWPDFDGGGKESIRVRDVMSHTAGLRGGPARDEDRETTRERIEGMSVERGWEIGETLGYSPAIGWDIFGELIARTSGQAIEAFVTEEIMMPCGMRDCWIGIPLKSQQSLGDRIARRYDTRGDTAVEMIEPGASMTHVRPGGNVWGPIRELGRFYQMLLNGGELENGQRLLAEASVAAMTEATVRGRHDKTFSAVIDWGMGMMMNSWSYQPRYPYNYGGRADADAFGHGGSQSSMGFADPAAKLIVMWAVNGQPGEKRHQTRNLSVNEAIYIEVEAMRA